jgi:hypothetical protein
VETVRIYTPRSAQLKLLLGATAFVAAGFSIMGISVYGPVGYLIAILAIGFFGPAGIYFLSGLLYRRPALQVDARGITDRSTLAAAGLLRWEDIGRASIQTIGTQRMLAIAPRDPAAVMARANLGRRLVMRMNAGMGFPAVNIPEVAVAIQPGIAHR